ncbi:MAG: DNA-3-methyladenine glycosylase 2 family protein, partial [Colwellia sp.]|nr:DNA-3-methyladenine glycosylase 2 family protein [Colwellia sp.]
IAYAAGFNSIRRFNDCFQTKLKLTPSSLRKNKMVTTNTETITLFLSYRPPYAWSQLKDFLQRRAIAPIEWLDEHSYSRSFTWPANSDNEVYGQFTAIHKDDKNGFEVNISISDINYLMPVVRNIRRILDLDAPINSIDSQLSKIPGLNSQLCTGLRLPGTWSLFEAGVRAVLGQQISVVGALKLVATLVAHYGTTKDGLTLFPQPQDLLGRELQELKMPASRRATLLNLASFMAVNPQASPDEWLALKGIGPWTIDYAKMRGLSDPNIWLGSDLGVKKALNQQNITLTPKGACPWQSYLTFQVWNIL